MANTLHTPSDRIVVSPSAGLAIIFTATIFLSATLLFSVQPMFTKLILPLLGGASNVWNTAMVFFQAMLLGGYVYAHLSSKYLPLKAQLALHVVITLIGLSFLPLAIGDVSVPETGMPTLWLLGLFAATVGAPFFALSANAPLIQRWFSYTDHPDASDPYFLYSASNAGSLLILCAYPILIEPQLRLGDQTYLWKLGYIVLIAMIIATGLFAFLRRKADVLPSAEISIPNEKLEAKTIAFWVLLSFIPSSLMLGVTSHMTNNIAAMPFLWILPLALYLLTFVIVFARKPIVQSRHLAPFIPWIVLLTLAAISTGFIHGFPVIAICLVSFFVIALYSHARLVEARPDVSGLTLFYIIMSVGGVLGGLFNALVAPILFIGTYEYPIVLLLAAFVLPKGVPLFKSWTRSAGLKSVAMAILAVSAAVALPYLGWLPRMSLVFGAILLFAATMPLRLPRPQAVLMLAVLMGGALFQQWTSEDGLYRARSFFSTLTVERDDTELGPRHRFMHGDTIHNFQFRDPDLRMKPASYYAEGGSIDAALMATRKEGLPFNVSVIGLGAGALACYEQPGDDWTYFEIDPAVVKMALNPELFSFMADCAPDATIHVGDARQKLDLVPAGTQDLVIVDAFSSDSIPAHLVTREALALYRTRLKSDGLVFFHTSNRMMDVTSVVVRLAEDAGLDARYIQKGFDDKDGLFGHLAHGVLVGPSQVLEQATANVSDWSLWEPSQHVGVWTDDYSAVVSAIRAKWLRDGTIKPITQD